MDLLVRLCACSMAYLYLSARLSNTHRATEAGSSGGSCPVSSQKLRMREGMSPGERNVGWSGSTRGAARGASSARRVNSSYEYSWPSLVHCLRHSCNNQRPMTFFKRRVLPPNPPSLVKLALSPSSVATGPGSSTPTRDQVPLEM